MKDLKDIIKGLEELLRKGNAHVSLDDATQDIPFEMLGKVPENLPYSIWQLTEHIRIAQWDILEFCKNEKHVSPKWPDEYWPKEKAPKTEKDWEKCLRQIHEDRNALIELIKNSEEELTKPFSYGDGQSLFKEALVVADHNSYHTAEIVVIRRLLRIWKN